MRTPPPTWASAARASPSSFAFTLLAPDIQEELLFLEVEEGVERVTERALRDVVAVDDWEEQRRRWRELP